MSRVRSTPVLHKNVFRYVLGPHMHGRRCSVGEHCVIMISAAALAFSKHSSISYRRSHLEDAIGPRLDCPSLLQCYCQLASSESMQLFQYCSGDLSSTFSCCSPALGKAWPAGCKGVADLGLLQAGSRRRCLLMAQLVASLRWLSWKRTLCEKWSVAHCRDSEMGV